MESSLMITLRPSLAALGLAILVSSTVACGIKAAEQTGGRPADTYSPISSQAPASSLPSATTPAQAGTGSNGTTASIPADLHFSPADITYLNSLDPAARDAAIQRQRDNLQALKQAAKLSEGYTDSLKNWSIRGATRPVTK
jgi:hypothetical protein